MHNMKKEIKIQQEHKRQQIKKKKTKERKINRDRDNVRNILSKLRIDKRQSLNIIIMIRL